MKIDGLMKSVMTIQSSLMADFLSYKIAITHDELSFSRNKPVVSVR